MMNGNKGVKMPRGDKNTIPSFMLPLPPLEVQQQIVAECEQIDDDYKKAKDSIENCKQQIESIMQNSQKSANIETKLSNKDVFDISIGRRILSTEISEEFDIPVYSANVFEPFGKINKLLLKDFDVDSVIWGIDGDWMVNVLPANYQFFPTDHCGVLRIKDNYIEPKYIAWVLNKAGEEEGFKRSYRASIDRIEGIVLNLPPLKTQKQIVAKITAIEGEIQKAKEVMDQSAELKAAVLKKYLE